MSSLRLPFLLLALGCLAPMAHAATPLTWDECAKEALANHPDMRKAAANLASARFDKQGKAGSFLPSLSASASANKSGNAGSIAGMLEEDTGTSYRMGLSASVNLFNGFKDQASWNAASIALRQAEVEYRQARVNLSKTLRDAFTNLLYAQQQVILSRSIAARQKENVRMVELRYESGRENKGSLLNSQAAAAQAALEATEAERSLRLAQRQLLHALGRGEGEAPVVSGDFTVAPPESAPDFPTLAKATLSYQLSQLQERSAQTRVKSAKGDFLPTLNANASMSRSGSDWVPNQHSWGAGLALSLPLFEGGQRVATLRSARADHDAAKASLVSSERSSELSLESSYWGLRDSIDALSVQKDYLAAAQARQEVAQAQYANGLLSYQDWDQVENNLISREKGHLQSLRDVKKAEAAWRSALGKDELP